MGYGRYWQSSITQPIIDEWLKMKDINGQVTTYVEKKIPFYRLWNRKDLKDMIKFFSDLGQLIVHQNTKGKIDGVLALQFVDKPEDIKEWKNDFNSDGVAIVVLASDNKHVRSELVQNAILVSGVRSWVCFERGKYNDRMRVLPWNLAERMA
jgi:hypothetical protein